MGQRGAEPQACLYGIGARARPAARAPREGLAEPAGLPLHVDQAATAGVTEPVVLTNRKSLTGTEMYMKAEELLGAEVAVDDHFWGDVRKRGERLESEKGTYDRRGMTVGCWRRKEEWTWLLDGRGDATHASNQGILW